MMTSTQLETCSPACATALRSDRAHGLIYGPYGLVDEHGKLERLISSEEFAGHTGHCTYCNGPLPRGRANRILRLLAPTANAR